MFDEERSNSSFIVRNTIEVLKKNFLKILVWGVLGGLISLVITLVFMTPKYESNIDLLVNQKASNEQVQYNVQQADLQAINTYRDVLKKSVVLVPVLKEIRQKDNYSGNLTTLQSSITISNETNSQVLGVSVTDKNAYTAADIANTIGVVFSKKIKKMMKVDNVTVVTKANPNLKPISPNKKINVFVGIVVGLFFGVMWFVVRNFLDTTIKNESFIVNDLGLVNLGFVGHLIGEKDRRIVNIKSKNTISKEKRVL